MNPREKAEVLPEILDSQISTTVGADCDGAVQEVLKLLDGVECLRTTKDRFPEHPLYVPYEVTPKPYEGRTGNSHSQERYIHFAIQLCS